MKEKDEDVEQCHWQCPICKKRCGGWEGHRGEHECPEHYRTVIALIQVIETIKNILKTYGYEVG